MGYVYNRNYIYRNDNGGIYQDGTDYKVDWFNPKYVPNVSISFSNYNTAYFYLNSVE